MTPIVTQHRIHLSVSSRHRESRRAGCFPAPSHPRFKPFHSFLQARFQRGKAGLHELSVERAAGQLLHTDTFRFRVVILNRAVELHRFGDQLRQHSNRDACVGSDDDRFWRRLGRECRDHQPSHIFGKDKLANRLSASPYNERCFFTLCQPAAMN